MTIRFLLDGIEVTGPLSDADYHRTWYVHSPLVAVRKVASPTSRNLTDAILAARELAPQDAWISSDPNPPPDGWPD